MRLLEVRQSVARAMTTLAAVLTPTFELAQPSVGPGEHRFSEGIYKASHNSYERDESYASQVDNWNCWCLELDLHWHGDDTIRVHHLCDDDGPSLRTELGQITQSVEQADRVTVVYLELKGGCLFSQWPERRIYRSALRSLVTEAFGDAIYPASEFKAVDQFRWPSYQELLRRGYRWIVIVDEEATGFADDEFFFGVARGNPPAAFEDNSVLVNFSGSDTVPDRGEQPDRWLFRAYPGIFCDVGDSEGYFDRAVSHGYNLIATNCIDRHYTMTPTTHSPSPVRVTSGGSGNEFGTFAFPYRFGDGLLRAVARASAMVPISVVGGMYHVPAGTRLDRPVVLRANGGTVRITAS